MSHVSCDCTLITFTLPTSPIDVYFCHCLECRKQSSSAFGCSAIFPASAIWPLPQTIQQHLSMWTRPSKTGGTMQCYFCNTCGSRIMHVTVKPDGGMSDYISVKGGVINGLDMSGAKHIYTRSAVVPVPVPDGCPGSPSET